MSKETATHSQIPFITDLASGLYYGFQAVKYINTHPNRKVIQTLDQFNDSENWADQSVRLHIAHSYGSFAEHPKA